MIICFAFLCTLKLGGFLKSLLPLKINHDEDGTGGYSDDVMRKAIPSVKCYTYFFHKTFTY